MKELLVSIWSSKHTSLAGVVVVACALGEIWFPQWQEQFHKTREFAMGYGLLLAGDGIRKGVKSQTELLTKDQIK
jgi:hypothetical protein